MVRATVPQMSCPSTYSTIERASDPPRPDYAKLAKAPHSKSNAAGSRSVAVYRVYPMDRTGVVGLPDWFEANDDDDAISKAFQLKARALKCEVWQRTRLVLAFDGERPAVEKAKAVKAP